MRFSHDVYAKVKFNTESQGYISALLIGCSEDLYDELEPIFGHELAADASSWTELACIGEEYEHEEFIIEMVEV